MHIADAVEQQRMGKRVLVVEDNKLDVRLFEELLFLHRVETRSVLDPCQAMDALRTFKPDMIVMDIRMPGMDGVELIGAIRHDPMHSCMPVLAVTAYHSADSEKRLRAAGATSFMAKPISVANFIAVVERMIGSVASRNS